MTAVELMRLHGHDPAALEKYRNVVERQVLQLSRLVDDLLDISRITRGKIALKKELVTMRALLDRALESAEPLIRQRRHDLRVDCPTDPLWVEVDPIRLVQVLSNLLNNAAKYTEPGGRIVVSVAREGEEAVISVKDNGIGIPQEMLLRVFDLFVQVDRSLDRSQGGLGIGLTLARTIVELHSGRVTALSDGVGQGSEVEVRLPCRPGAPLQQPIAEAAAEAAPTGSDPASRRVLIVDDNIDAARSLADLVGQWGYDVRVVYDSDAALRCAAEWAPGVVLLDIGLPGMNGYELGQTLRAARPGSELRLVAVTGYGQESARLRAVAAGFDAYLVKPADLEHIAAAIEGRGGDPLAGSR